MKRQNMFSLMSAWPRLTFVALKVIPAPVVTVGRVVFDVYLTDNKEQASHLFVCQVADKELDVWVARLSYWMKEYNRKLSDGQKNDKKAKTSKEVLDIPPFRKTGFSGELINFNQYLN